MRIINRNKTLVKDSGTTIILYMDQGKATFLIFAAYSVSFLFCFLLLFQTFANAADQRLTVEVEVKGIEGQLLENVLASLKINRYRQNPRLTVQLIKKYHSLAPEEIKSALAPFGYFSPHIKSHLKSDDKGKVWKALYEIKLGKQIKVGKVNIKIVGPGQRFFKEISKTIGLKPGKPFLQAEYEKAKKEILNGLYMQGFAKANFVKSSVKVYVEKGRADIDLVIESGPKHLFGKTTFLQPGEVLTQKLLKKMLPYVEGDPYSPYKLLELQRRLESSRYFSEVLVEAQLEKAENNMVPILVTLKPGKKRAYSLGVGYGTDTGLRGQVRLECYRCNKKGHRFEGELALSEREQHISGSYLIPLGHPELHSIGARAAVSREETVDKISNLISAGLSYGKNSEHYQYSLFTELRGEDYRAGKDRQKSMLFMPGMRFSLIQADSRLRARKGLRVDLELSGASKGILSNTTFLRGAAYAKAIYPLITHLRLVSRLDLGATITDNFSRLPASLRFYAGGTQSVRGYRYKSLSPKDDSGDLIGGRYLLAASVELEYAIRDHLGIAFFYDAGNAMDDIAGSLKQGAGVGLRWNLSFGQIRLDIASALSRKGNPLRIHFSIGTDL